MCKKNTKKPYSTDVKYGFCMLGYYSVLAQLVDVNAET